MQICETRETNDGPLVFRLLTFVKLQNGWKRKSGEHAFRRVDASGIGLVIANLCPVHYIQETRRYASRIFILRKGKIEQQYSFSTEDGTDCVRKIMTWLWTKSHPHVSVEENAVIEDTMNELRRCLFELEFPLEVQ